ncbi:MAG: glycosyltransferase family 4 protein [Deltaproteobacteria bacterium]|nr:glycosyltransferase family 4 protein [Deltaproteobacteria bacterium]
MTSACRVLVLNERGPLHPQAGGAEVHVAEISRRLAPLGFEITQLACGFPGAKPVEALDGMTVRRLGNLAVYYPRAVLTTAWETFRGRFDVVVEHLNKVPFCSRAYSSVPVIAVNHHLFGTSAFLQVAWPIAATVVGIEKLIPLIYRRMPFLAVSESSKQDLIERGIRAERIDLLYNGITFPRIEIRPVTQRPCRVAYLGRLEPYKRIALLLGAVARLAKRLPRLELVLVGRGSERDALERLAAELGIARRTRFAGFVSDEERDALVGEARVCVCPSIKEGWGITVIEANALGVPVVATDAPGLRDAVRHDETGLLVADAAPEVFTERLAAAMERLLSDETLLARLSSEALAWSRRFDWDSSAQRMAEVIEQTRRPRRAVKN